MSWDVAGVGNALVDALVVIEDDSVLSELGLNRGTMHPVDHDQWMAAYERLREHKIVFESGGSCANTVATVGLLGGRAVYCGQVGDDQMGHMYAQKMKDACGQHALRFVKDSATGKCLSIISQRDAERTMLTDLGAATSLPGVGDFWDSLLTARFVHFEGYALLGGPMKDTVLDAMARCAAAGISVSFDAADPFVVRACNDLMWSVFKDYADLVFLNAEEARELTGDAPEKAIHTIAEAAGLETVVVKLGGRGSLVWQGGRVYDIPIRKVHAVDTTGAGDAYAGGFLYGQVKGHGPEVSGHLASSVAALTVSQIGAGVQDSELLARVAGEIVGTRA